MNQNKYLDYRYMDTEQFATFVNSFFGIEDHDSETSEGGASYIPSSSTHKSRPKVIVKKQYYKEYVIKGTPVFLFFNEKLYDYKNIHLHWYNCVRAIFHGNTPCEINLRELQNRLNGNAYYRILDTTEAVLLHEDNLQHIASKMAVEFVPESGYEEVINIFKTLPSEYQDDFWRNIQSALIKQGRITEKQVNELVARVQREVDIERAKQGGALNSIVNFETVMEPTVNKCQETLKQLNKQFSLIQYKQKFDIAMGIDIISSDKAIIFDLYSTGYSKMVSEQR